MMIRLLIADDHAVVRRGLKQILTAEPDMDVIGEAADGEELLALARQVRPDMFIIDITMPRRSGLETLKELRERDPRSRALILSMHPEDQYAVRVLKAGAAGYLTKDSAPYELVDAVRKIMAGGRYLSPTLAEQLAFGVAGEHEPTHEQLSDREYQVLCLLASGKCAGDVADELALSVKTVSTYRRRLLDKLGMKNNAELTRYAFNKRLVG
jgi:two-component system, NarL family, invasion response regulator UvrY